MTWKRPQEVSIENLFDEDCLVGSSAISEYPLTDAVGKAFDMFVKCQSQESALEFTKKWGFLYEREKLGLLEGPPIFPVKLFLLRVGELSALAGLSWALQQAEFLAIARVRENKALDEAIRSFWECVEKRDRFDGIQLGEWAWPVDEAKGLYQDPLYKLLTHREKRAFQKKIGPIAPRHSLKPFVERSVPEVLSGYAAQLLAAMFNALPQSELIPVQTGDTWTVEKVPGICSLDQIILWDLRKKLTVIRHHICEGCSRGFIPSRKHQKFCSKACSARMRMRKMRAKK